MKGELLSLRLELRQRRQHILEIVHIDICASNQVSGLSRRNPTHPLNPACSWANFPKSVINVSMASFMWRCRTDTQTGSASVNKASFCSFPPTVFS
jgi:hypothetical protein